MAGFCLRFPNHNIKKWIPKNWTPGRKRRSWRLWPSTRTKLCLWEVSQRMTRNIRFSKKFLCSVPPKKTKSGPKSSKKKLDNHVFSAQKVKHNSKRFGPCLLSASSHHQGLLLCYLCQLFGSLCVWCALAEVSMQWVVFFFFSPCMFFLHLKSEQKDIDMTVDFTLSTAWWRKKPISSNTSDFEMTHEMICAWL